MTIFATGKNNKMRFLEEKIPAYINDKRNIVCLILFTALFALVFINIYKPFSSFSWYEVSEFKFLVFSSLIILTGVLVVVISRIIMYYRSRKHEIPLGAYLLWVLCELFFMALFYSTYTIYLNPAREYLGVFKDALSNTALILLLPYAALHLYFAYRDKDRRIKQLEAERIVAPSSSKPGNIAFYDEKDELRLSINRENLLYIESADNYVNVWYLNKEMPTKLMLRNSLTATEKNLSGTNVVRCHRSFMINLEAVKVIRRQKDGVYMELGIDQVPNIPVSQRYVEKIMQWFTKND